MAFVSAIADLLARYAKISAAVVGLVYGIGFLVTASRMAEYDIPVSTLISAQYLMAGLFPSAMLCLTAFVAFWGFRYRNTDGLGPPWTIFVLFTPVVVASFWAMRVRDAGGVPSEELAALTEKLVMRGPFWMIPLGLLMLWVFIVAVRSAYLRWREFRLNHGGGCLRLLGAVGRDGLVVIVLYLLALEMLVLASLSFVSTIRNVYLSLPQAYGGGKPILVEMYVDGEKAPPELLRPTPGIAAPKPGKTVPLLLLLRTSDYYVVTPSQPPNQPVWTLAADTVYGITRVQ